MNHPIKVIVRTLSLVLLLLQLSGCVYLRLLELKNQFKDFDQYIQVRSSESFSLVFKQPVLHKDDIFNLSKLNPTQKIAHKNGDEWVYHFIKQSNRKTAQDFQQVSLIFRLKFNQQGKLEQWFFPNEFLAIVPPDFLEASLRSLGAATIFKLSRKIKAEVAQLKTPAKPPNQQSVKQVLGQPHHISDNEDLERYLYHFELITDWIEDGYEERKIALVKLDFVPQNQLLIKASPRFAGLKIAISFSKLLGDHYFKKTN